LMSEKEQDIEPKQDMAEDMYSGQYKSKEEAIAYAKEKVKSFRDPEDGIEIWALPSGGFDVVHNMNSNGRNHVMKNGGKKLGTIGKRYKGVEEGLGDVVKGVKRWAAGKPNVQGAIRSHNSAARGAESKRDVFNVINDKKDAADMQKQANRERQKAQRVADRFAAESKRNSKK